MLRPAGPARRLPAVLVLLALLGMPAAAAPEPTDQKTGSVLVYNLFTANTRLTLTNTGDSEQARVRLFFVRAGNGEVKRRLMCLAPGQTRRFVVSDLVSSMTGYLLAVAVDADGCPRKQNHLVGQAHLRLGSGHRATLGAVAISALGDPPSACDAGDRIVPLAFDGTGYEPVPTELAVDSVSSAADGHDTVVVLNRLGGSLASRPDPLGFPDGDLFSDVGDDFPWSLPFTGARQLRRHLSATFPPTTPAFTTVVPTLQTGWLTLGNGFGEPVMGAALYLRRQGDAIREGGAVNLRATTLGSGGYLFPVTAAGCP